MPGFFVTGTDTGVGKSLIAAALCHRYQQMGQKVAAMKPVASGCTQTHDGLRNDDALLLQQYCDASFSCADINPIALKEPVAPHLAAQQMNITIQVESLLQHYQNLENNSDIVIVEGVGGWSVPLNDQQDMALLATGINLPVILVVGMRLGCINHALLTAQAIRTAGLPLAGWVANQIDANMLLYKENINALRERIKAPQLASITYQEHIEIEQLATQLQLSPYL